MLVWSARTGFQSLVHKLALAGTAAQPRSNFSFVNTMESILWHLKNSVILSQISNNITITIRKPDHPVLTNLILVRMPNLSGFRMLKTSLDSFINKKLFMTKLSRLASVSVFECKMAAKPFKNRTQKVSEKWPFENRTVQFSDGDFILVIFCH
jgi:hypothetical protein